MKMVNLGNYDSRHLSLLVPFYLPLWNKLPFKQNLKSSLKLKDISNVGTEIEILLNYPSIFPILKILLPGIINNGALSTWY
jgi:hypothetical protein